MTLAERTQIEAGTKPSRRALAGIGRVLMWNGGSLWIGRDAGRVEAHAHHAIQITLALDSEVLLREAAAPHWHEHRGAIVMPHRRHQFDGCGQRVAQIFVEPETAQGRALLRRYGSEAITELPARAVQDLVASLRAAYAGRAGSDVLEARARHAIATLAGPVPAASGVDPRIDRAIAWVRERLDTRISLQDAAAAAHLSPSHFRHLFVAQTGASFRAYLLWARVGAAVGAAMSGQSWTAAAHAAGFADSAHLSRTCRRMFGIAPVSLVRE